MQKSPSRKRPTNQNLKRRKGKRVRKTVKNFHKRLFRYRSVSNEYLKIQAVGLEKKIKKTQQVNSIFIVVRA